MGQRSPPVVHWSLLCRSGRRKSNLRGYYVGDLGENDPDGSSGSAGEIIARNNLHSKQHEVLYLRRHPLLDHSHSGTCSNYSLVDTPPTMFVGDAVLASRRVRGGCWHGRQTLLSLVCMYCFVFFVCLLVEGFFLCDASFSDVYVYVHEKSISMLKHMAEHKCIAALT